MSRVSSLSASFQVRKSVLSFGESDSESRYRLTLPLRYSGSDPERVSSFCLNAGAGPIQFRLDYAESGMERPYEFTGTVTSCRLQLGKPDEDKRHVIVGVKVARDDPAVPRDILNLLLDARHAGVEDLEVTAKMIQEPLPGMGATDSPNDFPEVSAVEPPKKGGKRSGPKALGPSRRG